MKIAIYSGVIPSTSFIEHLIKGVSKRHQVYLFGTLKLENFRDYSSQNIFVYSNYINKYALLGLTFFRFFKLMVLYPKQLGPLLREISNIEGSYNKWTFFSKFLPMVLYRPDILHIQWAKDVEFYGFLQKVYGIKIILSLLGSHINYSPIANAHLAKVYRAKFPEINAFHAVSNAIKLEAQKYNAPASKIKVIRSPIPNLFFDSYKPIKKRDKTNNNIKLVSVGRFHWVKGLQYAIKALAILKKEGVEVEYTIIGSDQPSEEILYLIDNLGLNNNVKFVSNIEQEILISLLLQNDVMLLPSIMEGIANVVLEAMAIGLPVISTDCGGMNEVVKPNETGWLVSPRNPIAIADAVIDVLNTDFEELKRIIYNAHCTVKKEYLAKKSIDDFLDLYEYVLNES